MGSEWDLSQYQIEAAAKALEVVWNAIQSSKKSFSGTLTSQDVKHILRRMEGSYNGAGHLLSMLKSEKTAKGQIAKIADLCNRVSSFEKFANEHKIALAGVSKFLKTLSSDDIPSVTQEAATVAKRYFLLSESHRKDSSQSSNLSPNDFVNSLSFLRQKAALLPNNERIAIENVLLRGEQMIHESEAGTALAAAYKETLIRIVEKLRRIFPLSEDGLAFKRLVETEIRVL